MNIVTLILGILFIGLGIAMAYMMKKNNDFAFESMKTGLLTVGSIIIICSIGGMLIGLNLFRSEIVIDNTKTAEELCEEYNVSYIMIQTIAEYTDEDAANLAVLMKYCADNDMDVPDAIKMSKPGLTDEEADAILVFSDKRQRDADMAALPTEEVTEEK